MEYFPIFLSVRGRRAVVLGGGTEAKRKLELLIRADARPLVVATAVTPEIAAWVAAGRCEQWAGPFDDGCLADAVLAIAASDDETLDAAFSAAAQARSIPINVVDRPTLSTFIMPAIVDRSPVVIAISTGGASPTLAQWLRERIERMLPSGVGALARLAGAMRPLVQRSLPDPASRRRFWRATLTGSIGGLALAGEVRDAEAALLTALHREVGCEALPPA